MATGPVVENRGIRPVAANIGQVLIVKEESKVGDRDDKSCDR